MFKKLSIYLTILALVIGSGLMATNALADSDKSNKNEQKTEKKENKQENKQFNNLLPPGLRHAPGIEKRVENGKGLPFGWWFKLFGNRPGNGGNSATTSTTTPPADIKAPNIVFSTVIGIGTTTARFIWVTNEASNSKVWVSTTTPVNLSLTPNNQSTSSAYYHDLTVSGLTASTSYHYILSSTDHAGNMATTSDSIFSTN